LSHEAFSCSGTSIENTPILKLWRTELPAPPGSLGLAILALAVALPCLAMLSSTYWGTEQGAGGPFVLASGLWLLWRQRAKLPAILTPAPLWQTIPALSAFGAMTVLSVATGAVTMQAWGVYGYLVVLLACAIGWRAVAKLAPPVAYLAFVIPPPDMIAIPLTHGLKLFVAASAIQILAVAGYPVGRSGVSLFIGQYELEVAGVCSGMNSLFSLTALGLFYVNALSRAKWGHALTLCLMLPAVAVLANLARVVIIMLITYYFGDGVGQSFVHQLAGVVMFAIAMAVLVALDELLRLWPARRARAA